MAEKTPRLNLDTYAQGDGDWSHNDTVEALDELAIDRGPSSSRPTSGDYDHQMFYDLDQRILWRWDAESSGWNAAGGLGADVENFSTSGAADTVPVSQGDGRSRCKMSHKQMSHKQSSSSMSSRRTSSQILDQYRSRRSRTSTAKMTT